MLSVVLMFMVCGAFSGIQEGLAVEISGNTLSLDFESVQWSYTYQGKYMLVKDPRGLYQIYHPWDVSEDGDFASLSAEVAVPANWQKPIFLNLYANDTYVSEGWEQAKPRWTHTYAAYHNFVDHRFKQILIDDRVIWDQDVGDSEDFGYFSLDISEHVVPGGAFILTLRVLDKVSSATRLPGDEFHLGIWSWDGLRDPDAEKKFYTRVFWGDVALSYGGPLRSSVIAYENTYDEKHLQVGERLAGFALDVLKPRRQFFSEPPATWHYRGGIPGMNSILAAGLMRYWRATGDERVGRACANIACNMAYSWMSPTEPGIILNGDPLQQVYLVGYAMQDVLPLFWGYELTGDKAFLEKGAQVMRESILAERHNGSAFGLSRYWEMQDILYYYGLYEE